jgi:hypothetical protein
MSLQFKRHYKLVVALVLVSAVLILGLGDQPIVAYAAPGNEQVVAGVSTFGRWLIEDLLGQSASLAWALGLMNWLSS